MSCMYTVDVERFTGLNVSGFNPTEVLRKYFCIALARSAYYLREVLIFTENFHGTLENYKNRESLAQRIFPCLRQLKLITKEVIGGWVKNWQIEFYWSIFPTQKFSLFLQSTIFVLTNYMQLLLYISYEPRDLLSQQGLFLQHL